MAGDSHTDPNLHRAGLPDQAGSGTPGVAARLAALEARVGQLEKRDETINGALGDVLRTLGRLEERVGSRPLQGNGVLERALETTWQSVRSQPLVWGAVVLVLLGQDSVVWQVIGALRAMGTLPLP